MGIWQEATAKHKAEEAAFRLECEENAEAIDAEYKAITANWKRVLTFRLKHPIHMLYFFILVEASTIVGMNVIIPFPLPMNHPFRLICNVFLIGAMAALYEGGSMDTSTVYNRKRLIEWHHRDEQRRSKTLRKQLLSNFKAATKRPARTKDAVPYMGELILYLFLTKEERIYVPADLDVEYRTVISKKFSRRDAKLWYYSQVWRSVYPLFEAAGQRLFNSAFFASIVAWTRHFFNKQ